MISNKETQKVIDNLLKETEAIDYEDIIHEAMRRYAETYVQLKCEELFQQTKDMISNIVWEYGDSENNTNDVIQAIQLDIKNLTLEEISSQSDEEISIT